MKDEMCVDYRRHNQEVGQMRESQGEQDEGVATADNFRATDSMVRIRWDKQDGVGLK